MQMYNNSKRSSWTNLIKKMHTQVAPSGEHM